MSPISTRAASTTPTARPTAIAPIRLVRVDVHLRDGLVPRHEQGVAKRLELRMQRVEVELLPLDDEHGAVPELGLVVVDRVLGELLGHVGHVRQRLARQAVEGTPHSSSSPAPPASTTPASRSLSSISGVRSTASSPRATTTERFHDGERAHVGELGLLRHLADDRQHRPLHRHLDRLVRGRRAGAQRLGEDRRVDPVVSPRTRARPRTIVERITPELPFASIVAARWASAASCAVVVAVDRASASTIPSIVFSRLVPVSPSGTG